MKELLRSLQPYKKIAVVAEISCNHNQDKNEAYKLIKAAKECGADAVKIQAYTPDELTINSNLPDFQIKEGQWAGQTLYELYQKTYTPLEWLPDLFACAKDNGILLFSSVFGKESFAALEKVNCPAYKVASFELNDVNLVRLAASAGKPMIMSTGVALYDEIDAAIAECLDQKISPEDVHIMYCESKYPTQFIDINLARFTEMNVLYGPIGFSDHTQGYSIAQILVANGAIILEKHFTLINKSEDTFFSFGKEALKTYINTCKTILKLYNDTRPSNLEYKRSIYVVKDIYLGEKFTEENIRIIRPGFGLSPIMYDDVIGKTANMTLRTGTALKKEHING